MHGSFHLQFIENQGRSFQGVNQWIFRFYKYPDLSTGALFRLPNGLYHPFVLGFRQERFSFIKEEHSVYLILNWISGAFSVPASAL